MSREPRPEKLSNILKVITRNLDQSNIPFAVIGAMALGLYGHPRFTADIDIITEGRLWPKLRSVMENLGYTCRQKTDAFAQFESESGLMGHIDFLFVDTAAGTGILGRRIDFQDRLLGNYPVVQPTDYIILKMMAIANDPGRQAKDESDISAILQLRREGMIPDAFEPLAESRIYEFADRFGQRSLIEKYLSPEKDDGLGKGSNRL